MSQAGYLVAVCAATCGTLLIFLRACLEHRGLLHPAEVFLLCLEQLAVCFVGLLAIGLYIIFMGTVL